MSMTHDRIIDQFSPAADSQKPLTTWYAQGHSDGLGDRLLMFDNTNAPSWEILRFRPVLARDYRFEAALRERVNELAAFHHAAFPEVRPISELEREDGLAVVSTYVAGARLAEALKKPRTVAFAFRLIGQLVPAVAALQQHGDTMAHGAIDLDRIVLTDKGQLVIREHMVGAALASLNLTAARLWDDLRIAVAPFTPALDRRNDVFQIGLITLSLMSGRRISPADYPQRLPEILRDVADRCRHQSHEDFEPLRVWLERALQVAADPFGSASDAADGLNALLDEPEKFDEYLMAAPASTSWPPPRRRQLSAAPTEIEDVASGSPMSLTRPEPEIRGTNGSFREADELSREDDALSDEADAASRDRAGLSREDSGLSRELDGGLSREAGERSLSEHDAQASDAFGTARTRSSSPAMRWAAAVVAVLSIGEAAYIGRLLYNRESTAVVVAAPAIAPVGLSAQPSSAAAATPTAPTGSVASSGDGAPTAAAADASAILANLTESLAKSAAAKPQDQRALKTASPAVRPSERPAASAPSPTIGSQRTGALRLVSSLEVHVLDGDRVLGSSSDGPIVAPAGQHQFEFVNSAIGFHEQRIVDVAPGKITQISVAVPNGTLSLNAVPWATVLVDGKVVGDTPLGNVSVPPGEHEVVFRHPQLGERRQTAAVRPGATTRVAVNLQR